MIKSYWDTRKSGRWEGGKVIWADGMRKGKDLLCEKKNGRWNGGKVGKKDVVAQ